MCQCLTLESTCWVHSAPAGMTTTARGNRCAIVAGTFAWPVMRSRRGHDAKRSARSRTERSPSSSAHKRLAMARACAIPFCTPQRLCPPSSVHPCATARLCTSRCTATVTRLSRSRGAEDHAIPPSVVMAKWLDRSPAALGDPDATQGEGGWARLCPFRGPPSARLTVPVSRRAFSISY
jgi:hypothetical protein